MKNQPETTETSIHETQEDYDGLGEALPETPQEKVINWAFQPPADDAPDWVWGAYYYSEEKRQREFGCGGWGMQG